MDLFGAPPGLETDLLGPRQQVLCPGQRVLVVVLALRVDLGLGPSEDPELVLGSEVDKREGNGPRSGFPFGRRRKEEVADEVFV